MSVSSTGISEKNWDYFLLIFPGSLMEIRSPPPPLLLTEVLQNLILDAGRTWTVTCVKIPISPSVNKRKPSQTLLVPEQVSYWEFVEQNFSGWKEFEGSHAFGIICHLLNRSRNFPDWLLLHWHNGKAALTFTFFYFKNENSTKRPHTSKLVINNQFQNDCPCPYAVIIVVKKVWLLSL